MSKLIHDGLKLIRTIKSHCKLRELFSEKGLDEIRGLERFWLYAQRTLSANYPFFRFQLIQLLITPNQSFAFTLRLFRVMQLYQSPFEYNQFLY